MKNVYHFYPITKLKKHKSNHCKYGTNHLYWKPLKPTTFFSFSNPRGQISIRLLYLCFSQIDVISLFDTSSLYNIIC